MQVGHHGLESLALFRQLKDTSVDRITLIYISFHNPFIYSVVLAHPTIPKPVKHHEEHEREPPQHQAPSRTLTRVCRHNCPHLTLITAV